MKRTCLGCGALIPSGSYCPDCRPRNYGSTRAWRKLRELVLKRDGYRCRYCGGPATHADHVTPLAAGGRDELENVVAACAECNLKKGSKHSDATGSASCGRAVSARDLVAREGR